MITPLVIKTGLWSSLLFRKHSQDSHWVTRIAEKDIAQVAPGGQ